MTTSTGDLVGRTEELHQLSELLDGARQGRTGVLVLRGPAGIGKTVLLDAVLARAKDMTTVRASGLESEATVSMSGLFDVARPLLRYLDELPTAQARVLRGALGLSDDPQPSGERFAVGMALLMLVAAAAEDRPIVVGIDDVQWVDAASRDALLFAARRMDTERVAMIFTVREDLAGPELDVFDDLVLQSLGAADAAFLMQRESPGRLAGAVAEQLLSVAQGTPLALVELPRALTEAQRIGASALPQPMPVTARIEEAFTRRMAELPQETREALLVAAASFDRRVAPLLVALQKLGLSAESLEPAEQLGLIEFDSGHLRFRHPLVRSAIYASSTAADRRRTHGALADAHRDPGDLEQHARHRAAALTGPDDDVAALLEQSGEQSQARGALAAAASSFEAAADLSHDADVRALRRLRAAQTALPAGDGVRAMTLLDQGVAEARDLLVLARIHHERARLWVVGGARVPESEAFLTANASLVADRDPHLAVAIKADTVINAIYLSDRRAAVAAGEQAVAMAAGADPTTRMWASIALAIALGCNGELDASRALLGVADRLSEERGSPIELLQLFSHVALARGFAEDPEGARQSLEPLIRRARADGVIGALPLPLFIASNAAFLMGDWASADPLAAEAVELSELTGQVPIVAMSMMCKTLIDAGRGREVECRQSAASAMALMEAVGYAAGKSTVNWALGLLELGMARYEAAIRSLTEAGRLTSGGNATPPGVVRWRADLFESLFMAGRTGEARHHLREAEAEAEATRSDYAAAAVARGHGLLGADDDLDVHFARSQELLKRAPNEFERARTELLWGRRLVAVGRSSDAVGHLYEALAAFTFLEAVPWVEQARHVLEEVGEHPPPRMKSVSELLTPRQMQVAVSIALGRTPEEVAAQVFVTPTAVRRALREAQEALGALTPAELRRRLGDAGLLDAMPVAEDTSISVSVLGGFEVRVGSQVVTGLSGAPAQALQIVAAHGGAISADELAELLWPEEPRGRTRLRNVLWRLSEAVGPVLVRDAAIIRIAPEVDLDVAAFDSAVTAAQAAARKGAQEAVGPATLAISRYVGDLLAGQRVETWAVGIRERLRRRYLAMLDLLVAAAIERRDWGDALALLERAIEAEPYDEARYLIAARLLVADGRQAAALQYLRRGADIAQELGVPLSVEYAETLEAARTTTT